MLSKTGAKQVGRESADDVCCFDELGRCYEAVGEGGKCCPFDTDYGKFRLSIWDIRRWGPQGS